MSPEEEDHEGDNYEKLEIFPTKLLLPVHKVEPLFATHLEDVSHKRETFWSRRQLPPWALEIACREIDSTASQDPGHQD